MNKCSAHLDSLSGLMEQLRPATAVVVVVPQSPRNAKEAELCSHGSVLLIIQEVPVPHQVRTSHGIVRRVSNLGSGEG